MQEDGNKKKSDLAREVIGISRNTLIVNLRFMSHALSILKPIEMKIDTMATNGDILAYSPDFILQEYANGREYMQRYILHCVMHCLFKHPFVDKTIFRPVWDAACDIAVEYAISEMHLDCTKTPREFKENKYFRDLSKKVDLITAEKIYRYLMDEYFEGTDPNDPHSLDRLQEELDKINLLCKVDNHTPWYKPPKLNLGDPSKEEEEEQQDRDHRMGMDNNGKQDNNPGLINQGEKVDKTDDMKTIPGPSQEIAETWNRATRKTSVDMDMFSNVRGIEKGNLTQMLRAVQEDKLDYTKFLKKFAVLGEHMQINDDEFDYIFYTYGLKLYDNLPLIEPLEYKEVKRISEFVIAIDTSQSVQGDKVQAFIEKTYNILKSTESFFSKVNLWIIQCDAKVQEAVKITNQDEFDKYLDTMEIKGLGGTDFRPVFNFVDELIAKGEFSHLKGLIYFTDGDGYYPNQKPSYETAFCFLRDIFMTPKVPPWAMRITIEPGDLIKNEHKRSKGRN